jgi:hypothetical protein
MTQKIFFDGTDQYIMTRLGSVNNTTGAQDIILGTVEGEDLRLTIADVVVAWSEYKQADDSIDDDITWNSAAGMWKIAIPNENITQRGTAWLNLSGQDTVLNVSIIPVAIEVDVTDSLTLANIKLQASGALTDFNTATPLAKTSEIPASDITAIKAKTDLLTLAAINAEVDTALSDYDAPTKSEMDSAISLVSSVGTEKVIHPDYYTVDASEKTITLLTPYNTITIEQILKIINVTKGKMIIYDCGNPDTSITLATVEGNSIISWTPDFAYREQVFEDGDALQITVNVS